MIYFKIGKGGTIKNVKFPCSIVESQGMSENDICSSNNNNYNPSLSGVIMHPSIYHFLVSFKDLAINSYKNGSTAAHKILLLARHL